MRTVTAEDAIKRKGPQPRRSLDSIKMENRKSPNTPEQNSRLKYADVEVEEELEDNVEDIPEEALSYGWNREYRHSPSNSPHHQNTSDRKSPNANKTKYEQNSQHKDIVSPKRKTGPEYGSPTFWGIPAVVIVVSVLVYFLIPESKETLPILTKDELTKEIISIIKEFPSQPHNTWTEFSYGIKKVEDHPSHPSVFLLLHESEEKTPTCLAQRIAKLAMRFLNAANPDLLVLEGEELGKNETLLNDYGELIIEKQQQVEEHRTMIVKNLHKIPGEIARSFHSFCDVETPLVDKAVYLFTLEAKGAERFEDTPTMLAEKVLTQMWGKDLTTDVLMPLIVRITDTVIIVKPENTLTACQM